MSLLKKNCTRIGIGGWQLGGEYFINGKPGGYGPISESIAIEFIHFAMDNEILFFDTSPSYGFGRSEELLGKAISTYQGTLQKDPFICSKFGYAFHDGNFYEDFSPGNLVKSVNDTLKRLHRDCIDIILFHNPPDNFDFASYDVSAFERLIETGKIKSYGVSCKTLKGVINVLQNNFGNYVEAVYNPIDRRLFSYFSDDKYNAYEFICRAPLASGFINKKVLKDELSFSIKDIRSSFNDEQVIWVKEAVKKLAFLNDLEGGIEVSALRFQLSNNFKTLIIPGVRNKNQVKDIILALRLGPLPKSTISEIESVLPDVFYKWKTI